MYFIGIDLGTSAVKLLLMKSGGEIIKTVSESYPVNFPQTGWSEQNPEDWFEGSMKGLASSSTASTATKLQVSASADRCTDLHSSTVKAR